MLKPNRLILIFVNLMFVFMVSAQSVVISSYYNAIDPFNPADEWTELFVVNDNVDMRNWQLQDNNSNQTGFQTAITFINDPLWNHLRGGTIIIIHHRNTSSTGTPFTDVLNKNQGYIEVSANGPYFTGGDFNNPGSTLNLSKTGDLLKLTDASGTFVHALGHKTTTGSSWTTLPSPKLNYTGNCNDGSAIYVCPGNDITYYGTLTPQSGTTYVQTGNNFTFGLPNTCTSSSVSNENFWRAKRQPDWPNPNLSATTIGSSQVMLSWNQMTDPYPSDHYQGYMLLRNTVNNVFTDPQDGTTYIEGSNLGNAQIIKIFDSSNVTTYTDNITLPCTNPGVSYKIFPFRYTTDLTSTSPARGRAYNTDITLNQVNGLTAPSVTLNVTITASENPVCEGTNVTFTANVFNSGSGNTFQWKVNGVNQPGSVNPFTYAPANGDNVQVIVTSSNSCLLNNPAPSNTISMVVNPASTVGVTIVADANPVCTGTPVTFTATPDHGGTSPSYQWKVNGINQGTNSPVFVLTSPSNGDAVKTFLTSNISCAANNPAESNQIIVTVSSSLVPSVTIEADENPVCTGTTVTFTATPVNGGSSPSYQWKVNGVNQGTNSGSFSYIPLDNDNVEVEMISNDPCASATPVTSNVVQMEVNNQLPVEVSISVDPDSVFCNSSPVTYTATDVSGGGASPVFDWFVNDVLSSSNTSTFSHTPADLDRIKCKMTSSLNCAAAPSFSNTITMHQVSSLQVEVSINVTPSNLFCDASPVTFHSNVTNGGTTPSYKWMKNGIQAGTDSVLTFIPVNDDKIWCVITSSDPCASGPANSDTITMIYQANQIAGVTISQDIPSPVCQGTTVTFTASPVAGGNTPQFSWFVNGIETASGINSVYSYIPLDNDSIYCVMTSSSSCASGSPATSVALHITVVTSVQLSATVLPTPAGIVCEGTPVTFHAEVQNSSSTDSYEWFKNNLPQNHDSVSFTIPVSDGDIIFCRVTSASACALPNPVFSDTLIVSATGLVTPVISIAADQTAICPDMPVSFIAEVNDAGSFPVLEWMVGNIVVQSDTVRSYTTSSLTGNESVSCRLITSFPCAAEDTVISSPVILQLSGECSGFYLPTAFSPDGDGLNDEFHVITDSEPADFTMLVFDRWGALIFESHNIKDGWHGNAGNSYVPAGTYSWKITYKDAGITKALKGTVTVIR